MLSDRRKRNFTSLKYMSYVPGVACGVYWAHGLIDVISPGFDGSHFEFLVNQES